MTEGNPIPFVRIRTLWSDDTITCTGHLEEWVAGLVLLLYGDAEMWTSLQRRPLRAVLEDRTWIPAPMGPMQ